MFSLIDRDTHNIKEAGEDEHGCIGDHRSENYAAMGDGNQKIMGSA